jgi:hypothetical protein
VTARIAKVADWLHRFTQGTKMEKHLEYARAATTKEMPVLALHESPAKYGAEYADVSF